MTLRLLPLLLVGPLLISAGRSGPELQTPATSVTYAAKAGPGQGKHVVFLTGDEEYRGEEGLPMLAKVLSQRHGFKSTVLFAVDPDGTINPKNTKSLSNSAALDSADAIVMLLRFRTWPDEDMVRFEKYLKAGKPIVALRTSTHAFNGFPKGGAWETWNYNNQGGFGKRVLGETWLTHWGRHKVEATRGAIEPAQRKAIPLLRGISGNLRRHGRLRSVSARGRDDSRSRIVFRRCCGCACRPITARPDRPTKSSRASTIPRCRSSGRASTRTTTAAINKVLTTTMGSATDLENEGLRRLLVNGVYWGSAWKCRQRLRSPTLMSTCRLFMASTASERDCARPISNWGRRCRGTPLPRPARRWSPWQLAANVRHRQPRS